VKLAILCQEEPVFLGPFLVDVIRRRPGNIAAVLVAGRRSGGEKHRSRSDKLTSLRIYWNIMEPAGFLRAVLIRLRARCLGIHDPRSVAGAAKKLGIPLHHIRNPNDPEAIGLLRSLDVDAVLNQSEKILKEEVLAVPRLGFINRHASLLPLCRGRLASFWSHAASEPRYGVTIHFVDSGIDTGAIIDQLEVYDVNPRWPYPKVLNKLCQVAGERFWHALDKIAAPGFSPLSQASSDQKPLKFPTLAEARSYRRMLAARRRHKG
jgi:folate-dependent phosphoribosylglycinamide formyltransferase PurN